MPETAPSGAGSDVFGVKTMETDDLSVSQRRH
jgi:hypothetical protein